MRNIYCQDYCRLPFYLFQTLVIALSGITPLLERIAEEKKLGGDGNDYSQCESDRDDAELLPVHEVLPVCLQNSSYLSPTSFFTLTTRHSVALR